MVFMVKSVFHGIILNVLNLYHKIKKGVSKYYWSGKSDRDKSKVFQPKPVAKGYQELRSQHCH